MFKGRYNHSLDTKGRVSLPARFRESLQVGGDDRVVLTPALDATFPHIDVYPWQRWLEFENRLAAKPLFDENVILLKRLVVANAIECPIDSHGRILVPAPHRELAAVDRDAIWLGMTRTIELWSPEIWARAESEALANIQDVRRGLAALDL